MKIGIFGDGQLARMLTLAARPLGIETLCLGLTPDSPGNHTTAKFAGDIQDPKIVAAFAEAVDALTLETENAPLETIQCATQFCQRGAPSIRALETASDRLAEKKLFQRLGFKTPKFTAIETHADLLAAAHKLSFPALLKTRRLGYDGKGQYRLNTPNDVAKYPTLHPESFAPQTYILEELIAFDYEVSLIAVRNTRQEIVFYPLSRNLHQNGILYVTTAPFIQAQLQQQAEAFAQQLMQELDYVGTFTIEFFVKDDQLYANEIAPRVHNSGHWTIEGAVTSQFENHIRAILGLPLGKTTPRGFSAMINCIGNMPPLQAIAAIPNVHYHTYEKSPRQNRKLGHVTLNTTDQMELEQTKQQLIEFIQFNKDYT